MGRAPKVYTLQCGIQHPDVTNVRWASWDGVTGAEALLVDPRAIKWQLSHADFRHDERVMSLGSQVKSLLDNGVPLFILLGPATDAYYDWCPGSTEPGRAAQGSVEETGRWVRERGLRPYLRVLTDCLKEPLLFHAWSREWREQEKWVVFGTTPTGLPIAMAHQVGERGPVVYLPGGLVKEPESLVRALSECTLALRDEPTPPPAWAGQARYALPTEGDARTEVTRAQEALAEVQNAYERAQRALDQIANWRRLL